MGIVAKIVGGDEYGPIIEWSTHWTRLIGKELSFAASASAEPVAEVVKWQTFTGHTAWDFKVFDKTLEHGAKLYAAPRPIEAPAQLSAEQERERFEAWFAQSGFWNEAITWKAWQARAALSAPTSMSGEPSGDFEKDLWSLVDEARQWEAAYRDSSMLYGSLDPYKGAVEVSIRHIVNRYAASAAPSAENRPAQDDVKALQSARHAIYMAATLDEAFTSVQKLIDAAIASQSAKERA